MPGQRTVVAVEEAFGERPAVVRAGGADRENLGAAADEHHGLASGVAEQHPAIGNVAEGDAVVLEVGAGQFAITAIAHAILRAASRRPSGHCAPDART